MQKDGLKVVFVVVLRAEGTVDMKAAVKVSSMVMQLEKSTVEMMAVMLETVLVA